MFLLDTSMNVSLKGIIETKNVNISLGVCTKTNIEGYVPTMSLPDKSTSKDLRVIIEHKIDSIPLHVCTKDNIEGCPAYVFA